MVLLVALILTACLDPWVDWFKRYRIPRGLGILIIYILLFAVIAFAVILIVPPISKEISQLAQNFPIYYDKIISNYDAFRLEHNIAASNQIEQGLNQLSQNLGGAVSGIFSTVFGVFGGLFAVLLVLVITFYLTVQETAMKSFIQSITPDNVHPYLMRLYGRIKTKMGMWLRGQIFLSVVIFVLTFIGLTILGVPYALVLAFFAGILEIVPFLGPIISAIPAVFFSFLHSPVLGISTVLLYFVIQQLENHLIVPKVMSKAVGLNPLVVIIAILVGAKLAGILGALLAVPVATGINVFLEDLLEKKESKEVNSEEA